MDNARFGIPTIPFCIALSVTESQVSWDMKLEGDRMNTIRNFVLDEPNVFRADGGMSQDAPRSPVSIRCPHCRELASFNLLGSAKSYVKKGKVGANAVVGTFYAGVRLCPNVQCQGLVFVIEDGAKV